MDVTRVSDRTHRMSTSRAHTHCESKTRQHKGTHRLLLRLWNSSQPLQNFFRRMSFVNYRINRMLNIAWHTNMAMSRSTVHCLRHPSAVWSSPVFIHDSFPLLFPSVRFQNHQVEIWGLCSCWRCLCVSVRVFQGWTAFANHWVPTRPSPAASSIWTSQGTSSEETTCRYKQTYTQLLICSEHWHRDVS